MTGDDKLGIWVADVRRPGGIHTPEAYAQSKMIDYSSWWPDLPRGITPSDIDSVYANGVWFLICENSRRTAGWSELPKGQNRLYADFVRASVTTMAILWAHQVPLERAIDHRTDCLFFNVLATANGRWLEWTPRIPGTLWEQFVLAWYADPALMRAGCLEWARQTREGAVAAATEHGNGGGA